MKIKLLDSNCLPTRGHEYDAGLDIRIREAVTVPPHDTVIVPAGFKVELPEGTMGLMKPRSSTYKLGIDVSGVIDCTYRGEVGVMLHNDNDYSVSFEKYSRVAQMIPTRVLTGRVRVVDELSETERGSGGFGSTGR